MSLTKCLRGSLFLLLGATLLLASEIPATTPKATPASPLVSEMFEIPRGSLSEIKAAVQLVLSERGKVVLFPVERRLFVQDLPENFENIRQIIQASTAPIVNVRLTLDFVETQRQSSRETSLRTRQTGTITVPPLYRQDLEITGTARNQIQTRDQQQSLTLLVQSGGTAALTVAREVAAPVYFRDWCRTRGLVTPEFFWTRVGSSLWIRPQVHGSTISVELAPQFTSLEDTLVIRELTTTVTLTPGQAVTIGGFQNAEARFNTAFFSHDSASDSSRGVLTLRATVESP
jgi:hypothetical protein